MVGLVRRRGGRDPGRLRAPSHVAPTTTTPRAGRCARGCSASRATSRTAAPASDARYVANDEELERGRAGLDAAPEAALDTQRDSTRLRAAIAALPPHYRDVLVLVELAERSYAETAAICGCELNTVRSRLFRARALIARWLDDARAPRTARG